MNESSVKVRVLFFAKSREIAGLDETTVDLPSEILYADLLNFLCEKYNLQIIQNCILLALNENYCETENELISLKPNDEIAIIPPISGG